MSLDQPLREVQPPVLQLRQAELFDRGEVAHPEEAFLEGADETLGAAVVLGLATMYVVLAYGRRIVDGREAVGFLRRVKELLEDPPRVLLEVGTG